MEVELRLPGVRPTAIQQVHPVGAELGDCRFGDALRRQGNGAEVVRRYLEQIRAVPLRNHQQMSVRSGVDVHERVRFGVLGDPHAGHYTGDDPAKQAVVGHRPTLEALTYRMHVRSVAEINRQNHGGALGVDRPRGHRDEVYFETSPVTPSCWAI